LQIKVLFFGSLIDVVGQDEMVITEIADSIELENYLLQRYPEIKGHRYAISINQKIMEGQSNLNDMDEVAIIPPFQGG